jgi:hypothetical protein
MATKSVRGYFLAGRTALNAMFLLKILVFLCVSVFCELIFANGAWAWGPAIHTAIGLKIIDEITHILPAVARVIQAYPLQYLYGSLAADFFVGKGQKKKEGHSHNWETGFKFFEETANDSEAAYGYGFFSHLAADVVAHNYFIPELIHAASTWKRAGHIYWEAKADQSLGPSYTRMARDLLSIGDLNCDHLLRSAVRTSRNGFKTRKHLFTQTVRLSDFLSYSQSLGLVNRGFHYQISEEYLAFMINLSYRLVKDFLTRLGSSPCVFYDPIGSENLRLASSNGILSKLFNTSQPMYQFRVDQELLTL